MGEFTATLSSSDSAAACRDALEQVAAAVRLGAHVLARTPDQMENQLRGRLPHHLLALLHDPIKRTGPWLRLESQSLAPAGGPLIRTLTGHTGPVVACAFSPDGRLAVSASFDNTLRVWDLTTGRTVHVLGQADTTPAYTMSDGAIQVWGSVAGQAAAALVGHGDAVIACAFSPDGRLVLSASQDYTLRLWDVETGRTVQVLQGHTGFVLGCLFSPGGELVLSWSSDETLRLWDTASGQMVRELVGHAGRANDCVFSPMGLFILSASDDHTLRLWDVSTGQTLRVLRGHDAQVNACAFSPDGRHVLSAAGDYVSDDNTLRLWDVATGQAVRTLTGHRDIVRDGAFSPDGRLVLSASADSTLRLWEVATGLTVWLEEERSLFLSSCAFTRDGRIVSTYADAVRLRDVDTGGLIQVLESSHHGGTVFAIAPTGRLILSASGISGETLRLWDISTSQSMRVPDRHMAKVNACTVSPDGQVALTASNDSTLRLWDVASAKTLHVLRGHTDIVNACAISPDGNLAFSASSDQTLRLWDTVSGHALRVFGSQNYSFRICEFSSDGRLALSASDATTVDGTIRIWDVATGQIRFELSGGYDEFVSRCAFSPDGHVLLAAGTVGVGFSEYRSLTRLWDVTRGEVLQVFERYTCPGSGCPFSPDGQLVLTLPDADTHTACLWDVANGKMVQMLRGHTGRIWSCAFSPDGRLVLTGSAPFDDTLRLWEVASGQPKQVFRGHTANVAACTFFPNGTQVISASYDGTLRLWDVASGAEVARCATDAPLECFSLALSGDCVVAGDLSGGVHFIAVMNKDGHQSVHSEYGARA